MGLNMTWAFLDRFFHVIYPDIPSMSRHKYEVIKIQQQRFCWKFNSVWAGFSGAQEVQAYNPPEFER